MTIQSSRLRPSFHIFQYKNHDQIFILKNNQFVAISIIISERENNIYIIASGLL